ncbi:MliC family protein [Pseudoxanthomonas japonensis]|nr:MliC family protein [Pseudoxanthomonas japonensis]
MHTGIMPPALLAIALALAGCGQDREARQAVHAEAPATPVPPVTTRAQPPADADATTTYLYQCGDWQVTANFDGEERVDISFNGRVLELPRRPSGAGARYADGAGNLFWVVSEGEALLSLQGQADRRCTRPPPAFR